MGGDSNADRSWRLAGSLHPGRIMLLIMAIAAAIRLWGLAAESLWLDETASWWFANRPLHELWGAVPFYEPHPPLYYTLLKGWCALFGDGEFALRSLSVVPGVLTVPCVYLIGRNLCPGPRGVWVGLLAAALLALNPLQIRYAQEARAYSQLVFGVALMLLGWSGLLAGPRLGDLAAGEERRRQRRWMGCVMAGATLAFWSHITAILLVGTVLGVGCVLLVLTEGGSARAWAQALMLVAVPVGLWLPNVEWHVQGVATLREGFWIARPQWGDAVYLLDYVLGSMEVAQTDGQRLLVVAITGSLAAAGAVALVRWGQAAPRLVALLTLAIVVPVSADWLFSLWVTPIFIPRPLLWLEIPFVLLFAASTLWLPAWRARLFAGGLWMMMLAVLVGWRIGWSPKEPWRDVAAVIARESRAGDLIVLDTQYAEAPMLYYRLRERSAAAWMLASPTLPGAPQRNGLPLGFLLRGQVQAATLERMRSAAVASGTVWHVHRGVTSFDPDQRIASALRQSHPIVRARVNNVETVLLDEYSSVKKH
jgi:mannosyltransferase